MDEKLSASSDLLVPTQGILLCLIAVDARGKVFSVRLCTVVSREAAEGRIINTVHSVTRRLSRE